MVGRMQRGIALGVVAAALLTAGCGKDNASSKPPKSELTTAIDNLGNSKALSATLKLGATPADLVALSKASGNPINPTMAGLVASSDVAFQVKSDKKLSDLQGDTAQNAADVHMVVDIDNGQVVELYGVHNVLYLRADMRKVLQLANKSNLYAELQARAAQLPAFAKAAVAGQWISINGDAAKGLASQLGGAATATPNPQQQKQLIDQLRAIVDKDVTVTRLTTGGDKGDHLVLTGNVRTLGTDLLNSVSSMIPNNPATKQLKPGNVPDKTVNVDAWVKDGKLSELSLDLVQFAEGKDAAAVKGKHLPIVMTFTTEGVDIKAPSGATPVDLSQLLPLMGALSPSTGA